MTMTMIMPVVMSVMMMAKSCHANKIHRQAKAADNEQLGKPLGFPTFKNALESLDHDFYANESVRDVRIHELKLSSGKRSLTLRRHHSQTHSEFPPCQNRMGSARLGATCSQQKQIDQRREQRNQRTCGCYQTRGRASR